MFENTPQPDILITDTTTSTLDLAFDLIKSRKLPEWASVLAKTQTRGKGQARKKWNSPPGNLYAALRLPTTPPFDSPGAAIIVAAYCALGLRNLGHDVYLKWPNDLMLRGENGWGKVGGILLEDKNDALVAGVGINLLVAPKPDELTDPPPFPPASLAVSAGAPITDPPFLWARLVKTLRDAYNDKRARGDGWRKDAEKITLWLGQNVILRDGAEEVRGKFNGLGALGEAIISAENGDTPCFNGSMRPIN